MAEFLLELFSEEIPARLQRPAEQHLERSLVEMLQGLRLGSSGIKVFSTPRRLAAVVWGLPKTQPNLVQERRGPRADAPAQAVEGFAKTVGVKRDALEVRDEGKGHFFFAVLKTRGRPAAQALSEALPSLIRDFPWPKSMTWGEGTLRWIRPLQSVLCLFDGKVVPFEMDGLIAHDRTEGHRFLSSTSLRIRSFKDYTTKLARHGVMLDAEKRKQTIQAAAMKLAQKQGLTLVSDDALLEELAGLSEWPVALMGLYDPKYLALPEEILVAVMRHHQRFFPVRKGSMLAPRFICISNTKNAGASSAIIKGNERVLSARLSDAQFFFEQDAKIPLADQVRRLSGVVFHEKLGSVAERVTRLAAVARVIGSCVPDCDGVALARAAALAKADLVSGTVGEFPELQGVMGASFASLQGERAEVCEAIRSHYSPRGPADAVPTQPVAVALALADKLELLASLFAVGEKPSGSKDPYALRRAALGAIRIIVENKLRIGLQKHLKLSEELMFFFQDRLKVQQKEQGVRHDLIDAVFSTGGEDDLVRLLARVQALDAFLKTSDGSNLLAGYKRAVSIVAIEEKKENLVYKGRPDVAALQEQQEKFLLNGLNKAQSQIAQALKQEDYQVAMSALASLREPVDSFFAHVRVNVEDRALRANRLKLLSEIRMALAPVADFSKIES